MKMCLQVNRYPFRECNCAIFMSAYLLNVGQLFTESVCSLGSKFVPVRVDPTFEGLVAEGSKQEIVIADRGRCFPSLSWRNHIEVYQLTLKHLPPVGANVFPLIHCLLVDSSTVICWTSPFVVLELSSLFCRFYFSF